MKRRGATVFALATLALAVLASTASVGSATVAKSQAINCKSTLTLPFMTPLTGGAGFLGNAQLKWAKFAVKTLAPKYGLKVRLVTGDTPVEQGGAPAVSLAQKYVSDAKVVALLGPSTSGAVASASQPLFAAGIAHVSPSATRTSLTKSVDGKPKEATPGFFRIVADDGIQGPFDARYMVDKLKVKKVVLLDFQEPYSVGLADSTQRTLRARGVTTIRESTSTKTQDFSSIITKVPSDTDIVFFPSQQPEDAQAFAQQLVEQGKKAKVFGGDGTNAPGKFKFPGAYSSNFAAPVDTFAYNKAIIAGWRKDNPETELEAFGPPTYGAVQVLFNAIKRACDAGKGTLKNRREVIRQVKKVVVKNWILGGTFRFSTKTNDPLNGQFYVFQIQSDGSYKLVS
jgi:branched-chain amino acid transport system substrate-binding protein